MERATILGTKLGTNYHPPSLVQIPSKGNKWFVVVTRPTELQTGSNIQVRRSTGTSDKRTAEAAMPAIAMDIYAEFDAALNRLPAPTAPKFTYVTDEATLQADPFAHRRMLPPLEPPKDPATKLRRFITDYLAYLETNQIGSHKERSTRKTRCGEFLLCVGDLYITDIKKVHAYQYAYWLAQKGLANKTIVSAVSRVSVMLIRAEKQGIIDANPFTNLAMEDYGKRAVSYLPFDPAEMKAIFAQKMTPQDRLCLTLLATTGARLDEIALLDWSQIKTETGITYLDLRSAEKIKNEQSRRVVPVHSKVAPMLAERGVGRIFDYPLDRDGKAQNSAGKRLKDYVNNVTEDPRKVLHSFRGTFKDMLKNAGVTPDMVTKLEAGEIQLQAFADAINQGQVSKELNDRITGHAMPDVAGKYGLGHALIPRAAAIEKLRLEFLPS